MKSPMGYSSHTPHKDEKNAVDQLVSEQRLGPKVPPYPNVPRLATAGSRATVIPLRRSTPQYTFLSI